MKILGLAFLVGLGFSLGWAPPALGHSADQDGKISALLHIDPDDVAKAGKTNIIHIYFNDKDSRFTLEGCYCRAEINKADEIVYSGPLEASGIKTGQAKVFLPQNNFSYSLVVSGTPKSAGFFQPFKLSFDIDVGNPPPASVQKPTESKYLLPAGILVIVLATTSGYLVLRKRIRINK